MSLDDIEIFVKIVDHNSFSLAAQHLRLPKSTVSRRIALMEERLGVKLLNRTTRQLSPTFIGQAYYEKCLGVLNQLEEVQNVVKGLQTEPKGRLRLSVPTELGLFFIKETITEFLRLYPEISLELELSNRFVDLVEEGFDLALRIGFLPDSSLTAVKLGAMQRGIYASADYFKDRKIPTHPLELPLDECIQFRTNHVNKWIFRDSFHNIIEVIPKGRLQVNSMKYMCESAVDGLGIAAISKVISYPYILHKKLISILTDYQMPSADMYAVYPSRKFLSPNVRIFIDYIKPRLGNILQVGGSRPVA